VAAGLVLDILIFSYFYLWTSAVAWLAVLVLLWFMGNPRSLRKAASPFVTILLLASAGLVPYIILLSHRLPNFESGQKLTLTHAPDFLRIPELLGLSVVVFIVVGTLRGRVDWRAPESLFALSFSLMPFVVFNQQVITGRSLQPFHYESFIANYVALVGAYVAAVIIWRGPREARRPVRYRLAARMAVIALLWVAVEVLVLPRQFIIKDNQFSDRVAAVGQRLRQLSGSDGTIAPNNTGPDPRPLVLATDNRVSMILPTFAPQAILWAPQFDFLNLGTGESRERFYKYLYYTGIDGSKFARELGQPMGNIAAAAFGHERVLSDLSVRAKPITSEEIAGQVADYRKYSLSFTRERAAQHVLSYVIVPLNASIDLSNLDHWYERDKGEQVGNQLLYRVHLRP